MPPKKGNGNDDFDLDNPETELASLSMADGQTEETAAPHQEKAVGSANAANHLEIGALSTPGTNPTDLNPASEFFHFFISYRVAYQADFSLKLHDRLYLKAATTPIPLIEFAKWPTSRFAYRRQSTSQNKSAHVFLDRRCLSDGDPWRDGFVEALRISLVFVPILSCSRNVVSLKDKLIKSIEGEIATLGSFITHIDSNDAQALDAAKTELAAAQARLSQAKSRADDTQVEYTGSVGDFVTQNPKSATLGVGYVDNYLLELIMAKELHQISSASNSSNLCTCAVILPVIVGNFINSSELTDAVCHATNQEASQLLARLGLRASSDILTYSARSIFAFFFNFQGKVLSDYGQEDHGLDVVSDSLIQRCCSQYHFTIGCNMLAMGNPLSLELQDWLRKNHAFHILYVLALNDIHSVRSLSFLTDPNAVWKLASEIAATTGKTAIHESAFVSELLSRAKASELSKSLTDRLSSFVDKDASSLSIMYSSSAIDTGLGKPSWRIVFFVVGAMLIGSAILLDFNLRNWSETWFNLSAGIFIFCTACIAQFISPFAGRKFCTFSFLLMGLCTVIGVLLDKFSSGSFDEASCHRCTAVYFSGPVIPHACRVADAVAATYHVMGTIFMFLIMSYKQSVAGRAWLSVTMFSSIVYLIEIRSCAPYPTPVSQYLAPGITLVTSSLILFFAEFFHFQAQKLARRKSISDDRRRNIKWQSLLSSEFVSLQSFCSFVQSACHGKNVSTESENLSALCQESSDIEELYALAHASNDLFQDVFEFLGSNSHDVPGSLTLCGDLFVSRLKLTKLQLKGVVCTLVRGPVKRPDRAISKIFRAYGGNVSRLTDLVRCSLFFNSFTDMESFTKVFFGLCNFQNLPGQASHMRRYVVPTRDPELSSYRNSLFHVERIRNRFDSSYQSSSAYKDFAIKVTIGVQASTQGRYALVPVSEWYEKCFSEVSSVRRNKSVSLFVCEVQLHHRGIQLDDEGGAVHENYVAMRDLVCS
jgi:hypothetical protein